MQRWPRVIVCVNLMDEAEKAGSASTSARAADPPWRPCRRHVRKRPNVVARLRQTIRDVLDGFMTVRPHLPDGQKPADCVRYARQLAAQTVPAARPGVTRGWTPF